MNLKYLMKELYEDEDEKDIRHTNEYGRTVRNSRMFRVK